MSSPTSTKLAPPTYVDPRVRRKFGNILMYIIQIWVSLIPASYLFYWFFYPYLSSYSLFSTGPMQYTFKSLFENLWNIPSFVVVILIPIVIIIIYIVTVVWSSIILKIVLSWYYLLHKPKEGVFYRSMDDKDYVYWNKRNLARIFTFWLLHSVPLTFLKKTFSYRFFGVPIGKNSIVNHCWISPEFVEIGNNVNIGQSAAIYSFQFEDDKLLVAKVIIEDGVNIGSQVVIFPGSKIENGVIIDGGSFCHPFTKFEENGIYHGTPVKLIQKNRNRNRNKIKINNKNQKQKQKQKQK